jgi:hypothetical protein
VELEKVSVAVVVVKTAVQVAAQEIPAEVELEEVTHA